MRVVDAYLSQWVSVMAYRAGLYGFLQVLSVFISPFSVLLC